jgi:hypothetical protein
VGERSRWVRWAVNVVHFEEKRSACRVLVGKPAGMRTLGIPGNMSNKTV